MLDEIRKAELMLSKWYLCIKIQLMKSLLGIESIFTLSGLRMIFNSTFLIAMLGVTYLVLDPIIKTVYVLRCFYGSALDSGEDLKAELNQILHPGARIISGLLIVILSVAPVLTWAKTPASVSPGELDQSIEEVMNRPEFSWRMPRETIEKKELQAMGPIEAAITWMLDMIKKGLKSIGSWVKSILDWLESLMPKSEGQPTTEDKNWQIPVRMVLLLLLFLFLAIMAFIFIRIWQRRRIRPVETASTPVTPVPDLNDEKVSADDLSTNRWLAIAEELTNKGDLRLAMRVLYLATLAHLADKVKPPALVSVDDFTGVLHALHCSLRGIDPFAEIKEQEEKMKNAPDLRGDFNLRG